MAYENILLETKNNIAYITINRPNVLNALNWKTMQEIRDAFLKIKKDNSVGGVIITGAGEKAFVAGADIKELATRDPVAAKEFSVASQEILHLIEQFPKPVIAAVN
ncbi:MAG: enoyl-CoA hydratase/isomerase family protein, partial [bacterium]